MVYRWSCFHEFSAEARCFRGVGDLCVVSSEVRLCITGGLPITETSVGDGMGFAFGVAALLLYGLSVVPSGKAFMAFIVGWRVHFVAG
jgi:hypothetical protein